MLKRFSRRWSVVVCMIAAKLRNEVERSATSLPTLERWERGKRGVNLLKGETMNWKELAITSHFLVPNVFVGNAYRDAPASHLIKKW